MANGTLNFPPGMREPAWAHLPEYSKSIGDEVADLCELAYYPPDPQQRWLLEGTFAMNDDNLSVAFEIAAIVGRQNLKTGFFKQCTIGWLVLTGERLVVWSSHEFGTTQEAFNDLELLFGGSDYLRKRVRTVARSHGSEAIIMKNGSRMIFKARTKGGGRGLTGDKIVLDEAYALQPAHMGALLPTLSVVKNPQLLYGSMAGKKESAVLRDVRDRGRDGSSPRLLYGEWCAPDPEITCDAGKACSHSKKAIGCGCDKPRFWMIANPTLGPDPACRMSIEYVTAERQAMPVDEFCRERMGWWDDPEEGQTKMELTFWNRQADRSSGPAPGSQLALGIHVAPDRSSAAIALAGWREDGKIHVELVEYLPGNGWLMDRVCGVAGRRHPCATVLDPASQAGAFEKELRNRGFRLQAPDDKKPFPSDKHRLHVVTSREYAQACGGFTNDVTNEGLWHPDQQPVNAAVKDARGRDVSGAWVWDESVGAGGSDKTPLVAETLARMGLVMYGKKEPPTPFFLT